MRNFVENFLAHLTVKTACIDILCEESYPLLNESYAPPKMHRARGSTRFVAQTKKL